MVRGPPTRTGKCREPTGAPAFAVPSSTRARRRRGGFEGYGGESRTGRRRLRGGGADGEALGTVGPVDARLLDSRAALGVAAVCSIATTSVLVGHFGAMSVGWMSLVASLVGFFALFDLGMSAIGRNAAAAAAGTALRSVIASSTRALQAVSVTMFVLTAWHGPSGYGTESSDPARRRAWRWQQRSRVSCSASAFRSPRRKPFSLGSERYTSRWLPG